MPPAPSARPRPTAATTAPKPNWDFGLPPRWGVLADDLTGATDVAAAFVNAGFTAEVVLDRKPVGRWDAQVAVLSTDSRHDTAADARRKVAEACRRLAERGRPVIYKKMDSTLQGNIVAEVEAIRDVAGFHTALVCAANPRQGRVIERGRLYVRGQTCGRVTDRLGLGSLLLLEAHRPFSSRSLVSALELSSLLLADASSTRDLGVLAAATWASAGRVLPSGSAGLAAAWARLLARRCGIRTPASVPSVDAGAARADLATVIICGSTNPVTERQLKTLAATGSTCEVRLPLRSLGPAVCALAGRRTLIVRAPVHRRPDDAVLRWLRALEPLGLAGRVGSWLVSGGDTALLVSRWLRPRSLAIRGEIAPGLAWGVWRGGLADGTPWCTKPGGFGDERSLARAVRFLRAILRRRQCTK